MTTARPFSQLSRRLPTPEQIRQLVAGNRPAVFDEQVGQRQPALVAGQARFIDRNVVDLDPQPLGQMGPHTHVPLPVDNRATTTP